MVGDKFSARNLSTAAHRVAEESGVRNHVVCPARLSRDVALADACRPCIKLFNPRNLASTAWAFAADRALTHLSSLRGDRRRGYISAWRVQSAGARQYRVGLRRGNRIEAFVTIARAASSRLGEFNPQNLANTAWAFAEDRDLATTARAFATARIEALELFAVIAREASSRFGEFNPQNLANTAYAFATTGIESPELFDAIAMAARSQLREFNPQALATTAWAFACVDWKDDPEFFAELECVAVTDVDALDDDRVNCHDST
ncbi:hypothetical protein CTAYLR_004475 [Chrysophaeum taylorii]|uniref:RNA-editing substrate-binding complex 6 protein domain-containing protein n=1 Tax=Chrysophaeum taylorii TaxID=2483200 RepID=A0AAD7UQ08_9STRA|nr:hypothetical protein CTAYLR_004423 [Chrysophaeum taylorii]KAJ8613634.1 hypothetical protein CTAYLR_004475 [Chrysophaeum taylorii]